MPTVIEFRGQCRDCRIDFRGTRAEVEAFRSEHEAAGDCFVWFTCRVAPPSDTLFADDWPKLWERSPTSKLCISVVHLPSRINHEGATTMSTYVQEIAKLQQTALVNAMIVGSPLIDQAYAILRDAVAKATGTGHTRALGDATRALAELDRRVADARRSIALREAFQAAQ